MSVTIGGVSIHACQVDHCENEATQEVLIWSTRGERNKLATCQSCAAAIELGRKDGKNALW